MKHDLSQADREFRMAFQAGALAPADFSHRAHARLAYVFLVDCDVNLALERMRAALVSFLTRHDIPASQYHETLTRAWVLAVDHYMHRSKQSASSADEFIDRNPILLDSRSMLTHYSAGMLIAA